MYCLVESPKVLSLPILEPSHIKHIKANKDSMFICAITSTDIMIWFTPSSMMIAFHQRADNSVSIHGENCLVEWKNDTSKIVVMTTKGYLIYYKIAFENEFVITDLSYAQTAWDDSIFSSKTQYQNPLLSCKISHEFSIHVQNAHKTFCCFNDEIYVPLYNGKVIKVPWTDRTKGDHFFILLQRIYFQYEPEDDLFKIKENIYITEFELMNADDGTVSMAAVLSDGSAIYLATDHTNTFRGLIARTHTQEKIIVHKCVSMNPLFKILAFGCKNGMAIAYNQPDDYTCLHFSHKYAPNNKDRESSNVASLRWSPDYRMLSVIYENGTFCLFSVFGSLLYDSKDSLELQIANTSLNFVKTLDFGIEGYSIWAYLQTTDHNVPGQLTKLKLLKSSVINNSSMGNIEHVSLNGEREIYICLNLSKITNGPQNESQDANGKKRHTAKYQYPSYKLGGNSIWQILNVPLTYLSTNFPIRLSAIDPDGKFLAVAGSHGFTHFSFITRKWKIFGNADQEKDIRVTGGLIWWREFICMSCYNSVDQRDEIRFYSRNSNLDNNYSKISKTSSPILQMNIFKNLLILFGMDCRIQVFGLEGGKDSTTKIILNKLIEIPIENYILNNPYLVVSVGLCPLYIGHFDDILKKNIESFSTPIKSILVNVSGNLLMFQPDIESLASIPEDLKKTKPFTSLPPIIISTNVENYWIVPSNHTQKLYNYLMNLSLWLNCGCNGVKVWLAMTNDEGELEQSNRVILNVPLKFYPLGLLINESLLIGADAELITVNQNSTYSQIQKTTQLFMPFLIEGMIKKRFSDDAKKLVLGYSYLPYFLHILELLVHKTLEEEAPQSTSDTSNRLLESVIKFISQFPEYLRIISHCTRKSEIAFWPYLFSIVGDSKNLFEECLERNDLETAASYLVVLQNIEHIKLCEKFANMLLKTALKNCEWDLVKEIMRFLTAIDPADLEENDVFIINQENGNSNNPSTPKTPADSASRLNQSGGGASNGRKPSLGMRKTPLGETPVNSERPSAGSINSPISPDETCSPKQQLSLSKSVSNSHSKLSKMRSLSSYDHETNKKSIEESIYEHAFELLKSFSIKQLFEMFANLPGMNILKWLNQYNSSPLVDNFVQALSSIHFEFNWPYPIYIQNKKTSSFMVNTELYDSDASQNPSNLVSVKKDGSVTENLTTTFTASELDSERYSCKMSINGSEIESINNNEDIFDFDLIAQELANTGSSLSERQLTHALDVFFSAKCYEWVFLLALVLKKFTIANEVIRLLKTNELSATVRTSLKKGIGELEDWSQNECCGYRSVMQNIHS